MSNLREIAQREYSSVREDAREKKLIVPTVHINGTNGQALADALTEAAIAVHDALDKLSECSPHGRDYYVQGSEAIKIATQQFEKRAAKLSSVESELLAIQENVLEQIAARQR